jgi:hypothetical protein
MDQLLRFDLPLDLNLLEQVVSSLYQGSSPDQVWHAASDPCLRLARPLGPRPANSLCIRPPLLLVFVYRYKHRSASSLSCKSAYQAKKRPAP